MDTFIKNYQNFVRSLYKTEEFIPLHAPTFNGNEKRYLSNCIDSTFVSSVGEYVSRFEDMMASYTGCKHAVAVSNGTSALHLALKVSGVDNGDEVITQALSFIATANAISYTGAKPVFVDVEQDTLGLSPDCLENWLRKNAIVKGDSCINIHTHRRIKACVPMHTFGHPCKIEAIAKICEEYNIELIEDAAESLGSFYRKKHLGTFSRVGIISFNGNKVITTGGGGVLLFNDESLAKQAKHLSTQAKIPHKWEFSHDHIGYNYRMPNINAALGCAQLENIDQILESKREIAHQYCNFFENTIVKFVKEPIDSKSNYWLNSILFENKEQRDYFLRLSNEQGIMARPIWNLLNSLDMYNDCQTDDLIVSKCLSERLVNIPSSPKY
ncbi:MAG: LegC family aminotransferase [Nitrososphaeraceae archaeon]